MFSSNSSLRHQNCDIKGNLQSSTIQWYARRCYYIGIWISQKPSKVNAKTFLSFFTTLRTLKMVYLDPKGLEVVLNDDDHNGNSNESEGENELYFFNGMNCVDYHVNF